MRKRLTVFPLLLLLAAVPRLPATTMIPLSLSQLEAASERIVIASALARECVWQDKKIVTVYTLGVAETIKGSATSTLTLVLPGGSVKEPYPLAMSAPGVPSLATKQKLLLFLQKPAGKPYTITGWVQGCYAVEMDPSGQERVDVPSFVLGQRAKAALDATGTMTLSGFVAEIRRAIHEREAQSR